MATSDNQRLNKLETDDGSPYTANPDPMADTDNMPPVTADVDETPKAVRYGAAVLLGLIFGVTCYMLGQRDSGYDYDRQTAASEQYSGKDGISIDGDHYLASAEPDFIYEAEGTATNASAAAQQPVKAMMAVTPSGNVVYLFGYDSAAVPENQELTAIAEHATKNGLCLDVRAYTDETGRPAYNQKLSERRAKAIGDYLIAHGIPANKVSVHGMGPTHQFGDDFLDRRAEVVEIAR